MNEPIIIGSRGNEAKRGFHKAADGTDIAVIETPKTDLDIDAGKGRQIIIRRFVFRLPPTKPGEFSPSKEELLNFHKGKIISFIYKDNLVLNDNAGHDPIKTVKRKKSFHVICECVPASGHSLLESTQNIQQILHK